MPYAKAMLDTHPRPLGIDADLLATCIEACAECAQICTQCADACLGEEDVGPMRRCITLDLDCVDLCTAAARVAGRRTEQDLSVLSTIVASCVVIVDRSPYEACDATYSTSCSTRTSSDSAPRWPART